MVEQISQAQRYATYVMQRLPEPEKGKVHTVQSGDTFWDIARKELNKPNAKNLEINNYMLLIAKLNNFDTIEKMNKLKVSQKIYLPKSSDVILNPEDKVKTLTSAEDSIDKLKKIILEDRTVFVEKMYKGYPSKTDLYHVYNEYTNADGYRSRKHPLLSCVKDRQTGEIKDISFDDQNGSILYGKYDYELDDKGNIVTVKYFDVHQAGKVDKKQLKELHEILKQKSEGLVNSSY